MIKKIFYTTVFAAIFGVAAISAQTKISVLGDSYSTFVDCITPKYNACWYFGEGKNPAKDNDVATADQTWWKLFADSHDCVVDVNNSYSGSTICLTGYNKNDYSDRAFITRIHNVGAPDILFVFGGTNDSWAKVPIGDYKYKKWKKKDLYAFRPAFCYLLHELKRLYPDIRIYNITNSELSAEITESMSEICKHYGITNILLHDIEKQGGHPSRKGMQSISDQLWEMVHKDIR